MTTERAIKSVTDNPGIFGYLTLKCGWLFLGLCDIALLVGVITMDLQGKFMHRDLILTFILSYAAPIVAFFGIMLQDESRTRYAYYLLLSVRFFIFVFILPLTVIHIDNMFLGKLVCGMLLQTQIRDPNVLGPDPDTESEITEN